MFDTYLSKKYDKNKMASPIIYNRETFIKIGKSQEFQISENIITIGKQLITEISELVSKLPPKPVHYNKSVSGGRYSKSSHNNYRKHRNQRQYNNTSIVNTPLHVVWRNNVNTKIKEDVEKQLKLELNKLNDKNSETIFKSVVDILQPINSVETDTIFIKILFDIAVIQQNFCNHYVNLLQYLETNYKSLSSEIMEICKQYFTDSKQKIKDNSNYEELSYNKKKITGHFFFVGTLYRYQLVSIKVIKKYWKLLTDIIESSEDENIIIVYSESICRFLCAIGNVIITRYDNKFYKEKFEDVLSQYLTQTSKFKPRIRFLFLDCIEKKNWID